MPNNAPSSTHPRSLRNDRNSTPFVDVSRIARQYAIAAAVHLDARVIREYAGHSFRPDMDAAECVIVELGYLLQCEPLEQTLSVILKRGASGRPVEVMLAVQRQRGQGRERIHLALAKEFQLQPHRSPPL